MRHTSGGKHLAQLQQTGWKFEDESNSHKRFQRQTHWAVNFRNHSICYHTYQQQRTLIKAPFDTDMHSSPCSYQLESSHPSHYLAICRLLQGWRLWKANNQRSLLSLQAPHNGCICPRLHSRAFLDAPRSSPHTHTQIHILAKKISAHSGGFSTGVVQRGSAAPAVAFPGVWSSADWLGRWLTAVMLGAVSYLSGRPNRLGTKRTRDKKRIYIYIYIRQGMEDTPGASVARDWRPP